MPASLEIFKLIHSQFRRIGQVSMGGVVITSVLDGRISPHITEA